MVVAGWWPSCHDHLTVADGRVVGSSPSFLGANPAVVPGGPSAGSRALTGEETLARELLTRMPKARRVAIVDPVAPPDILSGNGARADLGRSRPGFATTSLTPSRDAIDRLIRHYVGRAADDVAAPTGSGSRTPGWIL